MRWYTRLPPYNHIRVFGSLNYAHNHERGRDKFASRSRKCIFLGYPPGKKGWKLYDLDKQTTFVSRDAIFYEDQFPFADQAVRTSPSLPWAVK